MNEEQRLLLLESSSRFPPPKGVTLSYGTSGFRADASILQSTIFRVGILAALRSLKTQSVIGVMITASHNQVSDNGVKIADPNGGMMCQEWEPFADAIANASTPERLLLLITDFIEKEDIPLDGKPAEILLGRDTRPSGDSLLEATKQGISSIIGACFHDMGVLTTPQLHWMVRARNKCLKATELDYFEQLSSSFRNLIDLMPDGKRIIETVDDKLIVDGANGVGGKKLEVLKKSLDAFVIEVRNTGEGNGILNEGVGADFVQKEKIAPQGFGSNDVGIRCASLDGDADRLVYFYLPSSCSSDIKLIDGDKILSLFALFIKEQIRILNGEGNETSNTKHQIRIGVVQTAYANGASTEYLKSLGLEVIFTPTGVKYLHEKAMEYDIGIYFEANGHGAILFSESFVSWLKTRETELSSTSKQSSACLPVSEQHKAALRLLAVTKLVNQAVGDALSGLFLVEAILRYTGWSICKWSDLYSDIPSRMLKVKVVDRNAVVTTYSETTVVKPHGIQEALNAEIAKYQQGRSFIRPSGTEDVIRVYAEASTQEVADSLANSVAEIVDRFLGIGGHK